MSPGASSLLFAAASPAPSTVPGPRSYCKYLLHKKIAVDLTLEFSPMTPKLELFLLHFSSQGRSQNLGRDLASAATLRMPLGKPFPPSWPQFVHLF